MIHFYGIDIFKNFVKIQFCLDFLIMINFLNNNNLRLNMQNLSYPQQLQQYQKQLQFDKELSYRLQQMQLTLQAYQKQTLPVQSLPPLILDAQDLQRLFLNAQVMPSLTWQEKVNYLENLARFIDDFRQFLQQQYGVWALLNQTMLNCWVQYFPQQSYLELMAGNASLSWGLQQRKQSVIATDDFSWSKQSLTGHQPWLPVQQADALTAIQRYGSQVDVVLLAWSPDREEIDWQILKELRSWAIRPQLWVIGEFRGATNSLRFWQEAHLHYDSRIAKINQFYPAFDLVKDHLFVVR